ncbi:MULTISPECIES: hypothetical protein [Rhizobium]|uniref:hypothetical protein n=1 Tax=Rhizobium TaxID=379 RepID=UPI00234EAB6C|nr:MULTISPECIES: hypothetical protein [unclassified Rhizobium]MDC7742468.1 hypothetical protein [Rhizobium sp. BC56]MDC9811908.1 hypothetical protein [Rhizobium sp. MC62]MDC9836909.1 hypothetical protein [Rhizobium sp. MJ37]WEA61885.1 hypothetical protein PO860_08565 [Rhizobium sp. BJ04]
MDKTPKTAIRGMMLYVLALLALGILAGALYTIYGHPGDPSERPAAETIPEKATAPQ